MNILHFHPDGDKMITEYVTLLCRVTGEYAEVTTATTVHALTKQIKRQRPDIIHLHGCWNTHTAMAARIARRKGIRTVLTPHGQLEPWIIKQHYLKEKLPRIVLYQKAIVSRAYAVIVMGKMEEYHFKQLKWNPRVETARNAIITDTITAEDMCRTIYDIYNKVMHTDVLKLMNDETRNAVAALIKVGITGNHLWLNDHEYSRFRTPNNIEWNKLAVYAWQEGIDDIVAKGIAGLSLPQPDITPADIPYYLPKGFVTPISLAEAAKKQKITGGNADTAGQPGADTLFREADTQLFTDMIKQAGKQLSRRRLTLSHIVEIARTLRTLNINEAKAVETLREKGLQKFAARIMQLLDEMTGMEEGMMPMAPINDRQTKRIKTIITKHLEI